MLRVLVRTTVLVAFTFAAVALLTSQAMAYDIVNAPQAPGVVWYEVTVEAGDAPFDDFELQINPADGLAQYTHGALPAGWPSAAPAIVVRGGNTYYHLEGPALPVGGPYLFDIHYSGGFGLGPAMVELTDGGVPIHAEPEVGWLMAFAVPSHTNWGLIALVTLIIISGWVVFRRRRATVSSR